MNLRSCPASDGTQLHRSSCSSPDLVENFGFHISRLRFGVSFALCDGRNPYYILSKIFLIRGSQAFVARPGVAPSAEKLPIADDAPKKPVTKLTA